MAGFDYFVIFAEMRTGSNFLEANLNAFSGLRCHGEAFNPHFVGYPNATEILGFDLGLRAADPHQFLGAIKSEDSVLGGFRYFRDHDPRVLDAILDNPRCAKVILTRNPAESYVSWKIARETGQWKLTKAKHAKSERISFKAAEFETFLAELQDFQVLLLNRLQRSGQTAFYIDYEDLQDAEVINGLAAWLGAEERIEGLDRELKKQNPEPLEHKVSNFEDMDKALAALDRFNLSRTPNFEPRRGPAIPSYVASKGAPLLYLPLKGTKDEDVRGWLASLGGGAGLEEGLTQKTLRQWLRKTPVHRSFTVLGHPVARAHSAFCSYILAVGPGTFGEIRESLRKHFAVPLPKGAPDDTYDAAAHRAAFLAFLKFLKANLGGQTGIRVDPSWATQSALIQGFAGFGSPDVILRRGRVADGIGFLAGEIGLDLEPFSEVASPEEARLRSIYDDEIEAAARAAYHRDYVGFGFGDWDGQAA